MKKTRSFLLAASIMLALAFTFSCSDDKGDDPVPLGGEAEPGGVSLSELSNKQAYLVSYDVGDDRTKTIYEEGGDVFIEVFIVTPPYENQRIPAGSIQGGKVSLALQESAISPYLEIYELCDYEESYPPMSWSNICRTTGGSVSPANLSYFEPQFKATLSDGRTCYLEPAIEGVHVSVRLYYFSASGKITGTETRTETRNDETEVSITNINFNVDAGWNLVFYPERMNGLQNRTTSRPVGATLVWGLEGCHAAP